MPTVPTAIQWCANRQPNSACTSFIEAISAVAGRCPDPAGMVDSLVFADTNHHRTDKWSPMRSGRLGLAAAVEDRPDGRVMTGHRGWLLVYLVVLGLQVVHWLGLTVATVIVFANPELADLSEPMPVYVLVIYVTTNALLIGYALCALRLMLLRRRSAIVHNVAWNSLSVVFLLCWYAIGAKSPIGVVIDSLPAVVAVSYLLRSQRVRATYTVVG